LILKVGFGNIIVMIMILILLLIIYFVNTSILRKPFNTKLTAYVRYFVNQVDSK